MPVNENLNDYLESPYNFCYGAMKSRVVKDGLMESVVKSRPYRPVTVLSSWMMRKFEMYCPQL